MGQKTQYPLILYTLDTNAIIYYLKDDRNAVSALQEIFDSNAPVYISTITETELFSFPNLTPKEISLIDELLSTLSIIPLSSKIARIAGSLKRIYNVKLGDAVIAATTLFTGSTLLTRNVEDFRKIKELVVRKV